MDTATSSQNNVGPPFADRRSLSSSGTNPPANAYMTSSASSSAVAAAMDALASAAVKAAWNASSDDDAKRMMHANAEMVHHSPSPAANTTETTRPRSSSITQPRKHSFSSSLFPGDWIAQSRLGVLAPSNHSALMEEKSGNPDVLGLGMSSLGLGLESEDSAWARLHRSKSVDFRSSKTGPGSNALSHAISMEELLVDRSSHLPTPRDPLSRTNSPWTSPRLAPGPVAKPIRSPFVSPMPSPRREPDVALTAALAADLEVRDMLSLPPSIMESASNTRMSSALKNQEHDGDDTDATLNSPTQSHAAIDVVSPTLSTISIPLSALSQSTLSSLPVPPPVIIPYPTAEQIAHPDRNFSELDGLISDIVKRMLYRDEPSLLGSSGSVCGDHRKTLRASTPSSMVSNTPSHSAKSSKSKSTRNASLSSTASSSASTLVNATQPVIAPPPLPPADHAHITLNVAGAVPYHHHTYYGAPPPEPLQLSLRVVADRVETVNRLGHVKSRIEFRRVVDVPTSAVEAVPNSVSTNASYPPPHPHQHAAPAQDGMTFVTGPVMGKDDEPSLAEEIASVLEAVAEDTGSATLSVTVRSFVDAPKGGSAVAGDGSEGMGFKGAMSMASANSAGWYGGIAPCGPGKACSGDVMHDIWGYNVGPTEICPCGRHLAEGMRVFKLRKEVVAWVCSSSNGVPHHVSSSTGYGHQHGSHHLHPHAPPASATSPLHHGVVTGAGSMMVGYGAALIGQPVVGLPFERYV